VELARYLAHHKKNKTYDSSVYKKEKRYKLKALTTYSIE
jgi:hypothetical protein